MPTSPLVGIRLVYKKKKRESRYRLLVPRSEALELPITVERANTQRPHAEYAICP